MRPILDQTIFRMVTAIGPIILLCTASSPATEPERVLTPEDVAKEQPKEEVTVRFRVESTEMQLGGVLPKKSPPHKPIHLVPKVNLSNKKDKFYVILAGKALAHTHRLIENAGEHFRGKVVEATGKVRYVTLPRITRRDGSFEIPADNYTHYEILITHLDHLRVVHASRERSEIQPDSDTGAETREAEITPERVEAVRNTYRKVPPDILGIREPIEVYSSDILFDGGTIFLLAKDADRTPFHATIRFDRSYHKIDRDDDEAWARNYLTQPMQFSRQQNVNSGKYYALRGPEEAAMYGLLLRWSQQPKYTELDDEKLHRMRKHWTELFLRILDRRFALPPR